jgi:hypothetical protein
MFYRARAVAKSLSIPTINLKGSPLDAFLSSGELSPASHLICESAEAIATCGSHCNLRKPLQPAELPPSFASPASDVPFFPA